MNLWKQTNMCKEKDGKISCVKRIFGFIVVIILVVQMTAGIVMADDKGGDSNGGNNGGEPPAVTEPAPTFEPKVMVESYEFSKKTIYAGSTVTVQITLLNTSRTTALKNMMVTASIENEYMQLVNKTDSIYIPFIGAGGRYTVSYEFKSSVTTPSGQYDLTLSMNYADKDGGTYDASGKVKINIAQKAKVKCDDLIINSEAEVGDTIEAQANVMNLGRVKLCNVRAKVKADGLTPQGTIYIGNIEAGEKGSGSIQVGVGSKTKSEEEYGTTEGTITYYYETESGKKGKLKKKFSVNIKPFAVDEDKPEQEQPDNVGQWWIIMAVIGGILVIFMGYGIFRIVQRKSRKKDEMV